MRSALPLLAVAAALPALSPASAAVHDWPLSGFDRVVLQSAADVTIRQGPRFSVHADGDPDRIARLRPRVDHGQLVITSEKGMSIFSHDSHLQISITMPRIQAVALGGAGNISIDRVDAPVFVADLGGAGNIRIGAMRVDHTSLDVHGAGTITAAGVARTVDERVSGTGSIQADRLVAQGGRAQMSGMGEIRTRIDGPADVSMSGMGSVHVSGHPRCTINKSGIGSAHCD